MEKSRLTPSLDVCDKSRKQLKKVRLSWMSGLPMGSKVGTEGSDSDSSSTVGCPEQGLTFQAVSKYLLNTHDMLSMASVTLTLWWFSLVHRVLCSH